MKSPGTTYWQSPNKGATNESPFSALPGGERDSDGVFRNIRNFAFFWSTTEKFNVSSFRWIRYLSYKRGNVVRDYNYELYGLSVRCLKD